MENTFEKQDNQNLEEHAFNKLKMITDFLREKGFEVIDRFITIDMIKNPTAEMGFPIVRDGADGIRTSYDKKSGEIRIWFTNGFEDPDNQRRKEVEEFIKSIEE